jgi:hypothetical protein
MTFEEMPDEWQEWLELTPIERFRQSEKLFAQYLVMGGNLDPDPDPTSPFYDPKDYAEHGCYAHWNDRVQHPGLRLLQRGVV